MSPDAGRSLRPSASSALTPLEDARAFVRLLQCVQCSYPIREPMTLPCGNSLCKSCLPPVYKRENITYPVNAGRSEGLLCPFKDCGMEHSLADCSMDVTLNKIVEMVASYMASYRAETSDTPILLDERLHWKNVVDSSMDPMPRSRVLHGGKLVASYVFAEMGELDYRSEIAYTPVNPESAGAIQALDVAIFGNLSEVIRGEVECQVCYAIMLDPLTTICGHTFCRKCVARVLDHSPLCPICRRRLPMPPGVQAEPTNKRISQLVEGLFSNLVRARNESTDQEDNNDDESTMALFPCTLAYPHMPTFLHIFEPRYRLMVRRCVENGSRRFGMVMYNSTRRSQGTFGNGQFMQYGTILHVQRLEMFADGRSLLETQGISRFRILETSMLDGYMVGRVQRIDDISVSEEEANEAQETAGGNTDDPAHIESMSTQRLLQYGLDFITQARSRAAPWLHERVLAAYGQPPTDPATFPYWFASILPIAEDEKYQLLPTTSVRERLKMTARWIQRLEAARCIFESDTQRTVLDSSSDSGSDSIGETGETNVLLTNADEPEPQSSQAGSTDASTSQQDNTRDRTED